MTTNESKKLGDLFIKIGQNLKSNPTFINELETLLKNDTDTSKQFAIDFEKINQIDLFQLIRDKTENEVRMMLSEFNIKELREILKKYRFGSPSKLKTDYQIKEYILNQLTQRKTDVFQSHQNLQNPKSEIDDSD